MKVLTRREFDAIYVNAIFAHVKAVTLQQIGTVSEFLMERLRSLIE